MKIVLPDLQIPENSYIVIESDNCSSQYKWASYFHSQGISQHK